jgi:hypothetical protein
VSGLRIVGTPQRPVNIGVRLLGDGAQIDDVTIEANVGIGIDAVGEGAATVRASRLTSITGTAVRVGAMARPHFERDVFVSDRGGRTPAIELAADSAPEFKDNVFVGYADVIKSEGAHREQLLQQNLVVPSPVANAPSRRRTR